MMANVGLRLHAMVRHDFEGLRGALVRLRAVVRRIVSNGLQIRRLAGVLLALVAFPASATDVINPTLFKYESCALYDSTVAYGVEYGEALGVDRTVPIDDCKTSLNSTFINGVVGDQVTVLFRHQETGYLLYHSLQFYGCWVDEDQGCFAEPTKVYSGWVVWEGVWTVDVNVNGARVRDDSFTVKPYTLLLHQGQSQTIAVNSVSAPLEVKVLDPYGRPAKAGKAVTFKITSAPKGAVSGSLATAQASGGTAQVIEAKTQAGGLAKVYFASTGKQATYGIAATSSSLTGKAQTSIPFTVTVTGAADPIDTALNDPATLEKNLGDLLGGGGCGRAPSAAIKASTENPIHIASGNKFRSESDYEGVGPYPLNFTRSYNSLTTRSAAVGNRWRTTYDRSIIVASTTAKGKMTTRATAVRPDGSVVVFTLTGGVWVPDADVVDRLDSIAGGYKYTCERNDVETYNSAGRLTSMAAREGFAQTFSYEAQGRLSSVTDAFGRTMQFTYDASGRISEMRDPAGQLYRYGYDALGNLARVQYPDGATKTYHYENAALPGALTGITDESGVRFATFSYDASGNAVVSELAGGAQHVEVAYGVDGSRLVTDAVGNGRRYTFSMIQRVARRTSVDTAACVGCGTAATMQTAYDASGFVTSVVDYRGFLNTYVRNSRGLETSRTEAVGTADARTIATTWHATYPLPLSISETGRSIGFTYDSAGRTLTRTETDIATSSTRRWTYTYNGGGLLVEVDGPRTDLIDKTSYAYDGQGNLATATNAKGHVTTYGPYDAHGRPLSMTDPNGLLTVYTYDSRGRMTSRSAGGLTTSLTYTATGLPLRITRPDGTYVENQYDAAQRLAGIRDSAGQWASYLLDGNGRRLREQHSEYGGSSVFERTWTYDHMGRVASENDAQGQTQWRHTYDTGGNRLSSTDILGRSSSFAYDALSRMRLSTDPSGAVTGFAYDARDNLVRVTDPRGVITLYAYDGLNNLTKESAPDSGINGFAYDAAGNLKTRSWSNGRAVTYTLDALNRVTAEDYGSGVQVAHAYDSGAYGIGRLVGSADGAGSNAWVHDAWGRVVQTSRTTGTRTLTTAYAYDGYGRLAGMAYPSGRVLSYGFDSAGRINTVAVDGQAVMTGIAWQPFGRMKGWLRGNGTAAARTFDRNGRLGSQTFDVGTRTISYDAKGRIAQIVEPWGNRTFGYDASDRLLSESTWAGDWSYAWDSNGNRQSQSTPWGSTAYAYEPGTNRLTTATGLDARAFSYDGAGNTVGEGGYAYLYDARNKLVSSGAASYAYDSTGLRVSKAAAGSSRYYVYDEQRRLIGEYDDSNSLGETVWIDATPIVYLRGGQTYWIDTDQIDAPRAVRNAANQIVWRWRSEAFGTQLAEQDPSGLGVFEFNHRFPGQQFNAETALHYNDQRDYRAHTGRYVQSDPIGLEGGINTYAYAGGNPLSFIDPEGLMEIYRGGGVVIQAYPGPQAGGIEHARQGPGANYHVHVRDSAGNVVRMSTETWKPLTPEDLAKYNQSKQIQKACENLTEGEKKFLDRVNRNVFHRGGPSDKQLQRLGGWGRGGYRQPGD